MHIIQTSQEVLPGALAPSRESRALCFNLLPDLVPAPEEELSHSNVSPPNGCETGVTWEANFYFQGSIVENSRGMGRQELGKDKGAVFPFIGIFLSFHNTGLSWRM